MKKLIIILLFCLCLPLSGKWKAVYRWEWEKYTMIAQGIDCYDSMNCAAVYSVAQSNMYTVRVTRDGGYTWKTTLQDTSYFLKDSLGNYIGGRYEPIKMLSIDCISQNLSVVGCQGGVFYISKDGCESWEEKKIDTYGSFFNTNFSDICNGTLWNSGLVFITNDSTKSWQESTPDFSDLEGNTYIDAINWVSSDALFLSAYNSEKDEEIIIKSIDSGKTYSRIAELPQRISSLYFINENIGFAAGGNQRSPGSSEYEKIIYKTTDGGVNWDSKQYDVEYPRLYFKEIRFSDSLHGAIRNYSTKRAIAAKPG
jgi:hypothetical protein